MSISVHVRTVTLALSTTFILYLMPTQILKLKQMKLYIFRDIAQNYTTKFINVIIHFCYIFFKYVLFLLNEILFLNVSVIFLNYTKLLCKLMKRKL